MLTYLIYIIFLIRGTQWLQKKIKQSIKKTLILATTLVLVVGGTNSITFAETTNNSNLKDNEVTSYWSQHFSKFNSDLESEKLLELKDTSTVYLKYTQTNDNQEIVEKFTEDQYLDHHILFLNLVMVLHLNLS